MSKFIQNPWAGIKHLRFVTVMLNNFKMVKIIISKGKAWDLEFIYEKKEELIWIK